MEYGNIKAVGTFITNDPYVDARYYGVVADGVTDDYAALQAAINATPTGGTLLLPNGTILLTDTPVIAKGMTMKGMGTSLKANDSTGNFQGTWLKQTGASKDGLYVGIVGADLVDEIDGWIIENFIVSTNTNGNNGITIHNALRGKAKDIVVAGGVEAGIYLDYTFLNMFDNVRVFTPSSSGLGIPKYGWLCEGGPNTYIHCGAAGVRHATLGYGFYLNGEGSSTFTDCESEGNEWGFYFNDATWNTFINSVMEGNYGNTGSISADYNVGGTASTDTFRQNLAIGQYNSTDPMSLGAKGLGADIYTSASSGQPSIILSRLQVGEIPVTLSGKTHLMATSTDIATADTNSADNPLCVENASNTAGTTVIQLMNKGALANGRVKMGFDASKFIVQNRIYNTGGAGIISLNPLGGYVAINKTSASTALDVNGTVTATAFSGDGSAITSVSSKIARNVQTDNYILTLTDVDKMIDLNSSGTITLTIPSTGAVAFPTGSVISIRQLGAGQVVISTSATVTLNREIGLKTTGQHAVAAILKTGTDEWLAFGALEA